jgi:preflagellin peptidase FlaK
MDIFLIFRITILILIGFYLARSDLRRNVIPDKITYPIIILGFIFNFIQFGVSTKLIIAYLILLGLYFFFVLTYMFIKSLSISQTIGGGDVKFTLLIASLLPFYPISSNQIFIIKVLVITVIILFVMVVIKRLSLWISHKAPNSKLFLDSNINEIKVTLVPILWISAIISLFL